MEESRTVDRPVYPLSTPVRLLLAFLIGVPTTTMFTFLALTTPWWWLPEAPFLVLAITLLLAVVRDPLVLSGEISNKHITNAMITLILMVVAYFIFEFIFFRLPFPMNYVCLPLIPLMVGLVAAFALAGGRKRGFALACGACAWLGAALSNLTATFIDAQEVIKQIATNPELQKTFPKNITGHDILFSMISVLVLVHVSGIALAILGGEGGWRLRKRLLGERSVFVQSSEPVFTSTAKKARQQTQG